MLKLKLTKLKLHTAYFDKGTGNLKIEMHIDEYPGMKMMWTPIGVFITYRRPKVGAGDNPPTVHFFVPPGNYVGCTFAEEPNLDLLDFTPEVNGSEDSSPKSAA